MFLHEPCDVGLTAHLQSSCARSLQLNSMGFAQIMKIAIVPTVIGLELLMFGKVRSCCSALVCLLHGGVLGVKVVVVIVCLMAQQSATRLWTFPLACRHSLWLHIVKLPPSPYTHVHSCQLMPTNIELAAVLLFELIASAPFLCSGAQCAHRPVSGCGLHWCGCCDCDRGCCYQVFAWALGGRGCNSRNRWVGI